MDASAEETVELILAEDQRRVKSFMTFRPDQTDPPPIPKRFNNFVPPSLPSKDNLVKPFFMFRQTKLVKLF